MISESGKDLNPILPWDHFYHGSIRRYTVLFGSLMKGIKIARVSKGKKSLIDVPVVYATGKMYSKMDDVQDRETNRVASVLPMMSFSLVDVQYEPIRQTNQNLKIIKRLGNGNGTVNTQLNRIPYVFLYDLNVKTKNYDELLQVIEQVAPNFQDGLTVRIEDIPNQVVDVEADIRVTMTNFEILNEFEGPLDSTKSICEAVLHFRLSGYMYQATRAEYQTKQVVVKAQDMDSGLEVELANVVAEDFVPGTVSENLQQTTDSLFGTLGNDK